MVDALTFEKRGIPAATIASEKLAVTTGRGMARAHGVPDYPIAIVDPPIESLRTEEELWVRAKQAFPQVLAALLGRAD